MLFITVTFKWPHFEKESRGWKCVWSSLSCPWKSSLRGTFPFQESTFIKMHQTLLNVIQTGFYNCQWLPLAPSDTGTQASVKQHSIHLNISTLSWKRLPKLSSFAMPNIWHTYQHSPHSIPMADIANPSQYFSPWVQTWPQNPSQRSSGNHIS